MTKKTVSAKKILADIKAGMDDRALMEKYQHSAQGTLDQNFPVPPSGNSNHELENLNFRLPIGAFWIISVLSAIGVNAFLLHLYYFPSPKSLIGDEQDP